MTSEYRDAPPDPLRREKPSKFFSNTASFTRNHTFTNDNRTLRFTFRPKHHSYPILDTPEEKTDMPIKAALETIMKDEGKAAKMAEIDNVLKEHTSNLSQPKSGNNSDVLLEGLYGRLISRLQTPPQTEQQRIAEIKDILEWVAWTGRPLTIDEIYLAICYEAMDEDGKLQWVKTNGKETNERDLSDFLDGYCPPFFITKEKKVLVIHQSLLDFVRSHGQSEAEYRIAKKLLGVLLLDAEGNKEVEGLYSYAARFWHEHVVGYSKTFDATKKEDVVLKERLKAFFDNDEAVKKWYKFVEDGNHYDISTIEPSLKGWIDEGWVAKLKQ
ncbi:hypothetical protein BJ508DRAFT_410157 [Ascobolus immersus RN42]|uniref:Uncharacterized protein n=1 Tax=Ascobolus immersus RN42 TaxID=1160509 RepID=A0A3N4ISD3_ASCIM|nr:hypothetical protein BJ508DRAFT_410157 [Ascobolus immersus RN42]